MKTPPRISRPDKKPPKNERAPRLLWFGLALLLFGLFTFLAQRQAPRPDPFQSVQTLSWDWWQYPRERNAFKRLPVITSNLNDVFALPNSEKVWAVGGKGMIVHSEDGGETWMQQEVDWEAVADSEYTHDLLDQEQRQNDSAKAFTPSQQTQNTLRAEVVSQAKAAITQAKAALNDQTSILAITRLGLLGLNSVYFVDDKHGWVAGNCGIIIFTSNGGATWQAHASATTNDLHSIFFINTSNGWAVGEESTIIATSDGGRTWQFQASQLGRSIPTNSTFSEGTFESVHFINPLNGWTVASFGAIVNTTDGGKTWPAKRGAQGPLNSIYFSDSETGWCVGLRGRIYGTIDGGENWEQQVGTGDVALNAVYFFNNRIGWIVGDNGTITATVDGGKQWVTRQSGVSINLRSIRFRDVTHGWAVGDHGTIIATTDGGETWKAQTIGARGNLNSTHFVNSSYGWAVGGNGLVLTTKDGGKIWNPQESGTSVSLKSAFFINSSTGWAVGNNNTVIRTTNQGRTWQKLIYNGSGDFSSVYFTSSAIGWAVIDTPGEIFGLATEDSGRTWEVRLAGISISPLLSIDFADATTGCAVGRKGAIVVTSNGGRLWEVRSSNATQTLNSVDFINPATGWIAGENGMILATFDRGLKWQEQVSGTTNSLYSIHFANATTGWTVGDIGTILVTSNSGAAWQAQMSGTTSSLASVHFVNDTAGWVVGEGGTILATTDGGQTWKDPTHPYSRSFAPWYYLSLLLLSPLLYLAFRKPKPIETEQKTVADMLVSDRPIAAGDPDPLEFNAIARGLSRFLRNENTQPPLTIAITGEWGSGKSSLMNLLKADLERYGFRPVWFNAWHHQKEEHLLAALLQNIRKQALPRWWRPEGMSFRARLFWRRVRRYRALALLLLAGFAAAAGYFAADHPTRLHEAVQQIEHFFTGDATLEKTILGWLQHKLAALGKTSVLALLSSLGAALLVLWRGLRAFGVNPANLMASFSSNFKLSEVKAQMGFRHDFSREFSEVTEALNPRTMLILIDDLDRCRPENVLEVLEAVNFLVSSGDCYVVMGLDLTRIERCVGLGFKDVAEELVDQTSTMANSEKEEGKRRRAEFARQYLEKLVNIEVPVPQPQQEQSQNLIVPPQPVAPKPLLWWQNLLQMSAPVVRKVAPVLLVAAVLVGSMLFSVKYFSPQRETPGASTVAQATAPATTSPTQPTPSTPTPSPQRETPVDSSRGTGELIQPVKEPTSFTFVYIALAIMLGFGIWRLSIPTDLVVKDSPEFIDALKIWHPLLIAKRNTPRSVKRFVNRVRYFAMRQSAEAEMQSAWQKLEMWAGFKQKEEKKQVETIPESILVALSAIHHYDPKWIAKIQKLKYSEGKFSGLGEEAAKNTLTNESALLAIYQAVQNHTEIFGNWPPNEENRKQLEKLSAGIRIN